MKARWFCVVLLLSILAGCRKKDEVTPVKKVTPINGAISFSALLQSNMVVQRDKPFIVSGTSPAKLKIAVNVSWNTTTFNTVADAGGSWTVTVPATTANAGPQTIMAKADGLDAAILTNVVIGDVWVCSGQSNMVYPVDSISPFTGVLNYQSEIAAANYPSIRMLAVQEDGEATPLINLKLSVLRHEQAMRGIGKRMVGSGHCLRAGRQDSQQPGFFCVC